MRVALFVSTHGYGHAARSSAVAVALRKLDPTLKLEILTQVPQWFFAESLGFDFVYTPCESDVGLAQENAIDEDIDATVERLKRFWPPSPDALAAHAKRLRGAATDLIIADISPLGLAVAAESEIPAVLIENFTWDWIYEHQGGAGEKLAPFRDAYRTLYDSIPGLTIQSTPFCAPREGAIQVSPISRKPRRPRRETRRRLAIDGDRTAILLTMGGFSWEYSFQDALRAMPDVDFVIPGGSEAPTFVENLRLLPHQSEFFHPDLVHATDAIVGKVGYSTLAEAYAARTRFVYLARPQFPESHILPPWMEARLPTLQITREEFESASWLDRLEALLAIPRPEYPPTDGAEEAARAILQFATGTHPSR